MNYELKLELDRDKEQSFLQEAVLRQEPQADRDNPTNLQAALRSHGPGVLESPAVPWIVVAIHEGSPAYVACRRGGENHAGTAIHGDIDIIPGETPSHWEFKDPDAALILSLDPAFLHSVAKSTGMSGREVEIRNRFQIRDAQIEHIGWALQAEMERAYPCGRLYWESMATALAAQLIRDHSSFAKQPSRSKGGLSSRTLKHVLAFIEENIGNDLSLSEVANVAGLSVSHCKVVFRKSVGMPVHQYVIRRRVERAVMLLRLGKLSVSQIALETGFSNQSHLAMHLRRVLGISPTGFQRTRC
jgi:AraC family transcriptional regulator